MGIARPHHFFVSLDLKEDEEQCRVTGSRLLEAQAKKRCKARALIRSARGSNTGLVRSRRPLRSLLKKRGVALEGSRRPQSTIERKVTTLKKLIPNGESMGMEGLFKQTADYIIFLQMRVRIMRTMVEVLTDTDE